MDSNVYQRTVDYPEAYARGYHVALENGKTVTVRWDQVQATEQGTGSNQMPGQEGTHHGLNLGFELYYRHRALGHREVRNHLSGRQVGLVGIDNEIAYFPRGFSVDAHLPDG